MNSLWSLNDVSLPGRQSPRLDRVTVDIPPGVTAILGQSGAGKTSLLNVLVRYELPSSGRVTLSTENLSPQLRSLFWSPPTHGLWSHLSVEEHLSTVAVNRGDSNGPAIVVRLLAAFDLSPSLRCR